MNMRRSIKKGEVVKTHEIIVIDPETKKCHRITPSKPGQLFILRFDGVYEGGNAKVVEELPINIGGELAGCPA